MLNTPRLPSLVWVIAVIFLAGGCDGSQAGDSGEASARNPVSGLELSGMDTSVRPQDDFHQYANGTWLKETAIPAQYSSYSPFVILREQAEQHQRDIIQALAAQHADKGSIEQQIGDYFASFMNTRAIAAAGLKPLQPELQAVDKVASRDDLVAVFARFIREGISVPLKLDIDQDLKNSAEYTAYLSQSGLGLPDRDYYLKKDNKRFQHVLKAYPGYIAKLFALAGIEHGEQKAADIIGLETKLAGYQWSAIENRNLEKTYNPTSPQQLARLAASFDWTDFLSTVGIGKLNTVVVTQPSYVTGLGQLLDSVPLDTWKAYLQLRLLSDYAQYLNRNFDNAYFDFYGRVVDGKSKQQERWRRGIQVTNEALGQAIGRLYVAKYFPPEAKKRMTALVDNLLAAFATSIDNLSWMSEKTKQAARAKLDKFTVKIGYPNKWRDYSGLTVIRDKLIANVRAARIFEHDYQIHKLGKPIDRQEWQMTPQTVNAYYNPSMNEIVFPAAILQPPFFQMDADDAVNYGAIGMVIGHEISHGFDDQGSKFDGDGNMRNWWTAADRRRFEERTRKLVAQYNRYSPLKGMHVKGALTLGENIADLSGLTVAYRAYRRSLHGKPAPVMDGFTGDQRFFLGLAQAWRAKYRDAEMAQMITSDPHSPPRYRVNGVVANMPAFYRAFDVKPGDSLYLPPKQRVKIW